MPTTTISTADVRDVMVVPPISVPVQIDYKLQEIIDSIIIGIEQATQNQGTYLEDADLGPDDE